MNTRHAPQPLATLYNTVPWALTQLSLLSLTLSSLSRSPSRALSSLAVRTQMHARTHAAASPLTLLRPTAALPRTAPVTLSRRATPRVSPRVSPRLGPRVSPRVSPRG
jgi:hypothetical protein